MRGAVMKGAAVEPTSVVEPHAASRRSGMCAVEASKAVKPGGNVCVSLTRCFSGVWILRGGWDGLLEEMV
jgi:hypothetical protein